MISQEIVDGYKLWFNNYVNRFIKEYPDLSENIEIKADHCLRVISRNNWIIS